MIWSSNRANKTTRFKGMKECYGGGREIQIFSYQKISTDLISVKSDIPLLSTSPFSLYLSPEETTNTVLSVLIRKWIWSSHSWLCDTSICFFWCKWRWTGFNLVTPLSADIMCLWWIISWHQPPHSLRYLNHLQDSLVFACLNLTWLSICLSDYI